LTALQAALETAETDRRRPRYGVGAFQRRSRESLHRFVRKFVHDVTPAGLEQQLKDALAQELRTLARSMVHTQVYA
jgi:hypothetical protein